VSLADCVQARAQAMRLDAGVQARARQRARRSRCAILTNNGWFLHEHLPAMCPGLFPLFTGQVHCSAEYGIAKPEPELFLRCLQRLAVPASATLFIDDNIDNVQGARAAGLDAIHFTALPALDRALAERGLPEDSDHAT
jgi:putative hydrolase of the HAD superfamily